MGESCVDLPPGFRFHPTDEEIITHYLSQKILSRGFSAAAVGEVDLNRCEPWDLPSKAKMGEKEWYFFCQRDRKYPTGSRTNRATEAGYWKATGKDKEIFRGKRVLVGMKKTLVFYMGRAPKGEKTNWVMHEFRLEGRSPLTNLPRTAKDEWAVCKVFHKNMGVKRSPMAAGFAGMSSFGDDLLDSPTLPPLMDPPYFGSTGRPGSIYVDDHEALGFKGIPTSPTSMPTYFSTVLGMEDLQEDSKAFIPNDYSDIGRQSNPAFYPQIQPVNPYLPPHMPAGFGYLHQEQAMLRALAATNDASTAAMRRHCKAEQFSNQSMVSASQDTGLSTDRNTTEISSVLSKRELGSCGSYGDLDDPSSSAVPALDLENMWKY